MSKKSKQQPNQHIQIVKQQDSGTQKAFSVITKIFIGQKGIQRQINRSLLSNTYYSLLEIVHTAILFAVFNKSNSAIYSILQAGIGGFFFLVYLIPRLSKKHLIFQITFVLYVMGTIASGLIMIILFKYFWVFSFYCSELQAFYSKKKQTQYLSKQICQNIYRLYIIEIIVEMVILGLRFLYISLCFRAYMIAKQKYDEQQKKKRRRNRYNELLMKRTMYNQKRKV